MASPSVSGPAHGDAVARSRSHTRTPHDGAARGHRRVRWRKVLYRKQPFPDNHVDRRTFMASLTTNAHVHQYSYATMLRNSVSVVFQVCVLSTVFLLFSSLVYEEVTAAHVLAIDACLMASLYTVAAVTLPRERQPDATALLRTLLVFAFVLLLLSPVLRTLTASYSSDTVCALTIALSGFALASHDYSVPVAGAQLQLPGTTSLNASMFASVLVTSRLQSTAEVFAFEAFCILMFGLAPVARQCMQLWSWRLHTGVTALFAAATLVLLHRCAVVLAALFVLGVLGWLLCPAVFLAIQKFKTEIHGPWDIADVSVAGGDGEGATHERQSRQRAKQGVSRGGTHAAATQ